MEPSFDTIISWSFSFKKSDYDSDPKWRILESLYDNNYFKDKTGNGIPKKIHQIWFGGILPGKYVRFTDSWQRKNPDWEYKLWTDSDVDSIDIPYRDVFNRIENKGQKSDWFRYNVLNQLGGVYADTDFECLKSFNELSYLDFFTCVGTPSRPEIYIGLIASAPHHPVLEHIIGNMVQIKSSYWKDIFETTGTYFFTRNFFDVVDRDTKGVVVFPTDFFYPLYNNQMGCTNPYDHVKPFSYAIHHWGVSWTKK